MRSTCGRGLLTAIDDTTEWGLFRKRVVVSFAPFAIFVIFV